MKLLILLLLPAFCLAQQRPPKDAAYPYLVGKPAMIYYPDPPPKLDTVKCYVVVAEWNKDSTAHLIINKAWMVRRYNLMGHEVNFNRDTVIPIFNNPYAVKYLHANRRDSLSVIKDFTPIIQDWK